MILWKEERFIVGASPHQKMPQPFSSFYPSHLQKDGLANTNLLSFLLLHSQKHKT